jgi:hypothetical protein
MNRPADEEASRSWRGNSGLDFAAGLREVELQTTRRWTSGGPKNGPRRRVAEGPGRLPHST